MSDNTAYTEISQTKNKESKSKKNLLMQIENRKQMLISNNLDSIQSVKHSNQKV